MDQELNKSAEAIRKTLQAIEKTRAAKYAKNIFCENQTIDCSLLTKNGQKLFIH